MPEPLTPPPWVPKLIERLVPCFQAEDPIRVQAWRHKTEDVWHVDLTPTPVEEDGDLYVRGFNVHITDLVRLLTKVDIRADLSGISIKGNFRRHAVHIVIHLGEEDDDEDTDLPKITPPTTEKSLLN
jgi:hypothetical protein